MTLNYTEYNNVECTVPNIYIARVKRAMFELIYNSPVMPRRWSDTIEYIGQPFG